MDARRVALEALERVEGGAFANLVLPGILRRSGLDDRDRAFATDLVYGTLREQRACDHLIALASSRTITRLDPPVRAGLRLGAYQLVHGVAPHAAVNATVDAVGQRSPRARGFVNAVLRRLQTLGPSWPWPDGDDSGAISVRLSYPEWIVERLLADLGTADTLGALAAMNDPAPVTLRPNPRRTTTDALTDDLVAAGIEVTPGALVPGALLVRGIGDPAALAAVRDGRATPQDQASQAVLGALALAPGLSVLDVAAAPGGKATGAAEQVGDAGTVVACDVRASRLGLVTTAAARVGVEEIVRAVAADGRALPLASEAQFDRVLVDAPCSGLGVLRRRPEARWRGNADAIEELAALQRDLLAAAAEHTKPGGLLVYSVCTLTAPETTDIDDWAASHPVLGTFSAEAPPGPPWVPAGRGARVVPQAAGSDGMYLLVLRRPPVASGQS